MRRVAIVTFLALTMEVLGSAFLARPAHAVVVCQKGKRIKLRDGACKKKETQVGIDGVDAATLSGMMADAFEPAELHSGIVKANTGETKMVLQNNAFSVHGRCIDNGLNSYQGIIYVETTVPAVFASDEEPNGRLIDANTPQDQREINDEATSTDFFFVGEISDVGFILFAQDGSEYMHGEGHAGVHGLGADCFFVAYANTR